MDKEPESQLNIRNKQRRRIEASMQEAFMKLKELQANSDTRRAHVKADDVLCDLLISLGFENLVKEYRTVDKPLK